MKEKELRQVFDTVTANGSREITFERFAQAVGEVGTSLKVCTGCGHRSDRGLDSETAIACCLANHYIDLDKYLKSSRYRGKEFIHCKPLGVWVTVGGLMDVLKRYPPSTSFGFRNQPMQELHEIKYEDVTFVVFQ